MSIVLILIVVSEVGFWIVLALGLLLRYGMGRPVAGSVALALIPLIDVILLGAVAFDLHRGASVDRVHLIAGLYLGVSVAFGPSIVRWGDAWVSAWRTGAPKPLKAPKQGPAAVRHEMRSFLRWLAAAIVTTAAVGLLILTVAEPEQAKQLTAIFPLLGIVTIAWLVTGPVWALVSVLKPNETDAERSRG